MRVKKWKSSRGYLLLLDAQFVVQLALRRVLDTGNGVGQVRTRLGRDAQGCEQHVFVHMSGKVIFSVARCWSSNSFLSLNKKTEKARCKRPLSMLVMRWPGSIRNLVSFQCKDRRGSRHDSGQAKKGPDGGNDARQKKGKGGGGGKQRNVHSFFAGCSNWQVVLRR